MSRNTAREYKRAIALAGLLEGGAEELPELETLKAAAVAAMPPSPPPQQTSALEKWRTAVETMLEQHLGPQATRDRLRLEHPEFQGSLGSLKRLVRRIRLAHEVESEPGDVA